MRSARADARICVPHELATGLVTNNVGIRAVLLVLVLPHRIKSDLVLARHEAIIAIHGRLQTTIANICLIRLLFFR